MTQKHKRPVAPASKKLAKKASKPAAAAHVAKDKAPHAAKASPKHVEKHVEKHADPKKLTKVKTPEKAVAPTPDAKGKVIDLKPAQKLAAARAAAQSGTA